MGNFVQQGVEPDEIGRYAGLVQAVTPTKAGEAAAAQLAATGATIVVVGDAKLITDAIRKNMEK